MGILEHFVGNTYGFTLRYNVSSGPAVGARRLGEDEGTMCNGIAWAWVYRIHCMEITKLHGRIDLICCACYLPSSLFM